VLFDDAQVQQLQSLHPHDTPEEQQRGQGGWVGIAALSSTKAEEKEKPRKHKKAPRHAHHHPQQSDDTDGKSQLQTGFNVEQKKAAADADSAKNSVGVWNTVSQAPKQPDVAGDSSSSSGSTSSISTSSGSAVSTGSVTQYTRVLKVTYEGTAKDTGVVQKQSLAGVQPYTGSIMMQ
jgi:hypothetical protein